MFHFARCASCLRTICRVRLHGLPHSEIPGSTPAQRLPEAYRSHAASFFALVCQGILHTPFLSTSFRRCGTFSRTACTVIDAMITPNMSFQGPRPRRTGGGSAAPAHPSTPQKPAFFKQKRRFRGVITMGPAGHTRTHAAWSFSLCATVLICANKTSKYGENSQ